MIQDAIEYFEACNVANELLNYKPRHTHIEIKTDRIIIIRSVRISEPWESRTLQPKLFCTIKEKDSILRTYFSVHKNDRIMKHILGHFMLEDFSNSQIETFKIHGGNIFFDFTNIEDLINFFDKAFWRPIKYNEEYIKQKFGHKKTTLI